MNIATILVKLVGAVLLGWTIFSIYKHYKERKVARKTEKEAQQSLMEQFLNNILLYLWLAFMVIFSTGMILNN
jgi:Na+/melibiose symporter-like transporter